MSSSDLHVLARESSSEEDGQLMTSEQFVKTTRKRDRRPIQTHLILQTSCSSDDGNESPPRRHAKASIDSCNASAGVTTSRTRAVSERDGSLPGIQDALFETNQHIKTVLMRVEKGEKKIVSFESKFDEAINWYIVQIQCLYVYIPVRRKVQIPDEVRVSA